MHTIKNSAKDFFVNQAYVLKHKSIHAGAVLGSTSQLRPGFDCGFKMWLASKHVEMYLLRKPTLLHQYQSLNGWYTAQIEIL